MKHVTSSIWGTQEQAIASIRGAAGTVYRHKTLPIVGVISAHPSRGDRVVYAIWRGSAAKPYAYFSARDLTLAQRQLSQFWAQLEKNLAYHAAQRAEKVARRAALKASDHWAVGDVIYNSWGYEQTNVDFYQVTKVGARSICIRPISRKAADTAYMSGICQPDRFNFTGPEMRKPLGDRGGISFRHGGATKWDGRPVHYSYYH